MNRRSKLIAASAAFVLGVAAYSPAMALTMKECSAKYQAAKKAGTLNGMKWNEFRKAECGANASSAQSAKTEKKAEKSTRSHKSMMSTMGGSRAVFPNRVDPKYAKESAGRARLHTCVDQYRANKARNANGGLKWIEKGGGYWSECNRHLKGMANR